MTKPSRTELEALCAATPDKALADVARTLFELCENYHYQLIAIKSLSRSETARNAVRAAIPNMSNTESRFHVGMEPYIAADGLKHASYELLNGAGRAKGIADVVDGKFVRHLFSEDVTPIEIQNFFDEAVRHFEATAPIVFSR